MAISSSSIPKKRLKPNVDRLGRICSCKPSGGSPLRRRIRCGKSSRPASMIAFRIHLSPGSGYSRTIHMSQMTSQTHSPRMTVLLPRTRNCTRGAQNRVIRVSRNPSRKPITTCRATSISSLRLVLVDASRYHRPDSPFGPRPEIIAHLISESVLTHRTPCDAFVSPVFPHQRPPISCFPNHPHPPSHPIYPFSRTSSIVSMPNRLGTFT